MPHPEKNSAVALLLEIFGGSIFLSNAAEPSHPSTPPSYFFQAWQTDDGLPGNAVNDVGQDQTGFVWLATIGGLVRFDGVSFKPFPAPLITQGAARNIRAFKPPQRRHALATARERR